MKKIVISIIILFFIINIGTVANAKYVIRYSTKIADINVDREKPFIEITNIRKTKQIVESNENEIYQITFRIKIIETNIINNKLNQGDIYNNIDVKTKDNNILSKKISLKEVLQNTLYDVTISNIQAYKDLSIIIKNGIIMDIAGQTNDEKIIKLALK